MNKNATGKFSVLDFYRGQTLLVTGVTGFIGKVLLEKLLRECDLRCIYAIIRPGPGQSAEKRLDKTFESPALAPHRDKRNMVRAISGDITAPGLGLSVADRETLTAEVTVVIHIAATVVFAGPLGKFLDQNVTGTDSVMQLCRQMTQLRSVVYVSTAFGNCHLDKIEERINPVAPEVGLDSFLAQLEQHRDLNLQLGDPLLAGRPNPYTLSKSIAEWLIQDRYGDSLPVIICRPSVVINSVREPLPGWCDVKSGCTGAFCMIGTGIAQAFLVDYSCRSGMIPVDLVANGLIVAGAYRGSGLFRPEHLVVHLTPSPNNDLTWGQLFQEYSRVVNTMPTMKQVRPLSFNLDNRNQTVADKIRWFGTNLSHYLFAYLFDLICIVMGHRPFMVKLTDRMYRTSEVLKFFSLHDWNFQYCNNKAIQNLMLEPERFNIDADKLDWQQYVYTMCLGTRRYLLGDPDSTIEQAKARQFRLELGFRIAQIIGWWLLFVGFQFLFHRFWWWNLMAGAFWIFFSFLVYQMFGKINFHSSSS